MPALIGICGLINSGKDTAAAHLISNHNFIKQSFAEPLKDTVAAVFNWDRNLVDGSTTKGRQWREQVDPWWAERLGIPHLTPRWVLQHWGTEVCRHGFHEDIWVASLENKIQKSKSNTVITDCRFPNEVNTISLNNGILINIQRGLPPAWTLIAQEACTGCKKSADYLKEISVHYSEWSWAATEFDYVIHNNGSLAELYAQLDNIYAEINSRQLDHLAST
jgi:hypothetical protein